MRFTSVFYFGMLFTSFVGLTSCSNSSKLEGEWISTDFQGTLKVDNNKIVFDNITKREFVVEDTLLKVVNLGIADDYIFNFAGDTLILKKGNKIKKYLPKDKLPSEEEQIRVRVQNEAEARFEQPIKSLSLTKTHWGDVKKGIHLEKEARITDDEWVYIGEAIFVDNVNFPPAQLIIRVGKTKIGTIQPAWQESLESSARRYSQRALGIPAKKIELQDNKTQIFEGKIITTNDVELPIFLDKIKGIIPKQDAKSISAYYTFFLKNKYGKDIVSNVEINENATDNKYIGTLTLSTGSKIPLEYIKESGIRLLDKTPEDEKALIIGMVQADFDAPLTVESYQKEGEIASLQLTTNANEKINIKANVNGMWVPENDVNSIATTVKYKIQRKIGNKAKVVSIILKNYQGNPNQYDGIVDFSQGTSQHVGVKYTPQGIEWAFLKD